MGENSDSSLAVGLLEGGSFLDRDSLNEPRRAGDFAPALTYFYFPLGAIVEELTMRSYTFFVDGACSGNPGPAGAGVIGICGDITREWSIPLGMGTNQKAELLAIEAALLKVRGDFSDTTVSIYSDSEYAIGVLTKPWKIKANVEIIIRIRQLITHFASVSITKCEGHAGIADNERADYLAQQASTMSALDQELLKAPGPRGLGAVELIGASTD